MKETCKEQVKEPARDLPDSLEVVKDIIYNADRQVDNEEANTYIKKRIDELEYAELNDDTFNLDIDFIRERLSQNYDDDDAICIL